jgi:hypothetical protein
MSYRYFWKSRKRNRIRDRFAEKFPPVQLTPIPKRYRYSTRNVNYNPSKRENPADRIPYLFDQFEVAAGRYLIPRTFGNKILPLKLWGVPINMVGSGVSGAYPFAYTTAKYTDYYFTKIAKGANLDKWFHYEEDQCPITIIIGKSGSGKSVVINYLVNLVLGNGEAVIMAADEYCDWRPLTQAGRIVLHPETNPCYHNEIPFLMSVALHPVEVWIHADAEVEMIDKINRPNVSYLTFRTIDEILASMAPGKLTVVYDASIAEDHRTFFWAEIAKKINLRREKYVVSFVHHEVGNLLPQHPRNKIEWAGLQEFARQIVAFRKNDTRLITASQLFSEVYYRFAQKAMYIFWKQNDLNDYIKNPRKKKMIKELAIDEMLVEKEGSYSLHSSPLFPTYYKKMKMKTLKMVDIYSQAEGDEEAFEKMKDSPEFRGWFNNFRTTAILSIYTFFKKKNGNKRMPLPQHAIATALGISQAVVSNTILDYEREIERKELADSVAN